MNMRYRNHSLLQNYRHASYNWSATDSWLLAGLFILFSARLFAIIISPLELGVDEAQYWVWSQDLAFGYYSKPPLIAWIISISHALFGHYPWAVRLPAPIIQLMISLYPVR